MGNLANDISYVPDGFAKTTVRLADGSSVSGSVLEERSYPERYGLLDAALDEAVNRDVISPLPTSRPAHRSAYALSRLKTIRKRLFMLGYLERDSGQAMLGPLLEAAIIRFQQEAQLAVTDFSVDGWVGEQTWSALQELVGFEEPSKLERWFIGQHPSRPLKRAVQLRLFAFGLCPKPPAFGAPDDAAIDAGLQAFASVAAYFHWRDEAILAEPCFDTLDLLMDQDELVALLAHSEPLAAALDRKQAGDHPSQSDLACRFVINVTRAELWMLGYQDVAPAGYRVSDTHKAVARRYELRGNLFLALKQFWIDRNDRAHATMRAKQHLIKHFPRFFESLHQTLAEVDGAAQPDADQLFHQLEAGVQPEQNLIQRVWHELRAIGSRIWDGLKRAWHWFTAAVKRGVTWLKNLTRLAYNYILKSFEAVRDVVSGITGSLEFFAHHELSFPWRGLEIAPLLRMGRDSDFDFTTVVDASADRAGVRRVAAYLETKSSIFAISCRMFAALLDLVIDIIKQTLFTGWAVLLMALLKLYKMIQAYVPQILAFAREERRMLERDSG